MARGEKASALDTNRHQLSAPEVSDDESWAQALDNAAVQVGHMQVRYVAC